MSQPNQLSITLHSNGLMSIAKLLAWAMQGYAEAQLRRMPVGTFIALLSDGYGLSPVLAEKVLRGLVSYVQDDNAVTLLLDQDEADNYRHRQLAIEGRDIPRPVVVSDHVAPGQTH